MAVRLDNRWRSLMIFLSVIGHVIQPILADNDNDGHGVIAEAFDVEEPLPRSNLYPERIFGGEIARPGEWPWMVFAFKAGNKRCAGTLIDATHILSAAHCFDGVSPSDVVVHLGDHNIDTNDEVRHVERRVKKIAIPAPGFDTEHFSNDIAILTMDAPVQFTKAIRPVRLPSGSELYVGKTATVIGWGFTEDRTGSPVLRQTTTTILSNSECQSRLQNLRKIFDTILCDASSVGKSSCLGDSGGPLMVNEGGQWIQVGIVSRGIQCGSEYPSQYARVTKFMPWIRQNLK